MVHQVRGIEVPWATSHPLALGEPDSSSQAWSISSYIVATRNHQGIVRNTAKTCGYTPYQEKVLLIPSVTTSNFRISVWSVSFTLSHRLTFKVSHQAKQLH